MNMVDVAKFAIGLAPAVPEFSPDTVGELPEVFDHDFFVNGTEAEKRRIMLGSSTSKYESELDYPWDHYFGYDLKPLLKGKSVLDLGCFTGGRSVAWFERYELAHVTGLDVLDVYIEAARQFAESRNVPAKFDVGVGEHMPFDDESFDALLSFDVLEHVRDLERTLSECHRVLKPGGLFVVVFPGFFQPWEHHIAGATRTPGLHWLFRGRTLVKAYYEVLAERADSEWYRRGSPDLETWERGNTINGTTLHRFKRVIAEGGWRVVSEPKLPIGAVGRNATRHRAAKRARLVGKVLSPFVSVPVVQEFVRHRITFVLQK